MKYFVVEAHIDDSFLSMHQHMVDWIKAGHEVIICSTYTGGRKRITEIQAYADLIGAKVHGYGYDPELDPDLVDFQLPSTSLFDDDLEEYRLVCPLAIQNEQHHKVRAWVEKSMEPDFYYVDIPYYTKLKNEEEANSLMKGLKIVSMKKPRHYKGQEKYWKCFKGQALYFHYNPPEAWQNIPELLLENV